MKFIVRLFTSNKNRLQSNATHLLRNYKIMLDTTYPILFTKVLSHLKKNTLVEYLTL